MGSKPSFPDANFSVQSSQQVQLSSKMINLVAKQQYELAKKPPHCKPFNSNIGP
jgi:hypothetical protein